MNRPLFDSPADSDLHALAGRVGEALHARGLALVVAESCTGGWVAKLITDWPGSSGWFERGFVTYSNAAKSALLGVDPALLAAHGAVSEAAVRAMAEGALARSAAQLAVAISGVAGPDGGTADKPVGTVWLAWAVPGSVVVRREHFAGDRDAVRRAAVAAALRGVIDVLAAAG